MNALASAAGSRRVADALIFSSAWLAAAAGMLVAAASHAMGVATQPVAVGLAVCGTLVIYNVDRLRDLERDRGTSPERSAFVAAHQGALIGLVGVAGAASIGLAISAGWQVLALLAPVLGAGLLHRRLKRFDVAKTVYITIAWLVVVVGLPVALDPAASGGATVAAIFGATIGANAIAANIRDAEAVAGRYGQPRALRAARGIAGVGIGLAAFADPSLRSLAALPLCTLGALIAFRRSERFGLFIVDGALWIGAALAIALG